MSIVANSELIGRAQDGDGPALQTLILHIRPHVEHQLVRYPVSDEDRRDLLQSTLMQVVRRLGSFRGESSFSTWLFRVTANQALMLMRSQRRHRARLVEGLDLEDLGTMPAARASTEELHDGNRAERENFVRDALAALPPSYRDIVVAHYHQDLGLQEIADQLRVSESAVRSRLHRARSRLRAILEASALDAKRETPVTGEAA